MRRLRDRYRRRGRPGRPPRCVLQRAPEAGERQDLSLRLARRRRDHREYALSEPFGLKRVPAPRPAAHGIENHIAWMDATTLADVPTRDRVDRAAEFLMSLPVARRRRIFAATALVVACRRPASAQEQRRGAYMPPAPGTAHAVVAEHGMVVAQEKIAARIGADVLKRGGNAIDAAVATGFAMAVTYPRGGNIGGGGFMVIHSAERHEDVVIDYRETAPAATTPGIFLGP